MEVDIGFQEGAADFFERVLDVALGDFILSAQFFPGGFESIGKWLVSLFHFRAKRGCLIQVLGKVRFFIF
ncbi:MAG: hypothetical protein EAZ45_11645 [Oscillatoriales cyanobacterium]|nr:MAG: hypothetical protein EAZ45_11645 [Oscillatoriales cyanobacterium]